MTATVFSEIVVPLDLVVPCDTVLAVASTLARRAGVGVRLVTVSSPGLDHAADEADLHANAARTDVPSVATAVIESNDVVRALLETAGPNGLLVVETRARGALASVVLGSTTNALLRTTTRPVLLVGPSADASIALEVMEVCLDTADAVAALLPTVGTWARALELRLRFMHAQLESEPVRGDEEKLAAITALRAEEQYEVAADSATMLARSVPEAIVDDVDAAGAAIVAVGMRPRPARLRRALGSVAVAVAHATHAAVLAVPMPEGTGGEDRVTT